MKDFFKVGFGTIIGMYAAMYAVKIVDNILPEKYRIVEKRKKTEDGKDIKQENE